MVAITNGPVCMCEREAYRVGWGPENRFRPFFEKINGCGKWRGPAFPSAPGPSAVSGRSENLRSFDSCQSELPASVAPRSTAAPVRPRCPQPLAFGSSNRPMCVLAPQKCAGVHGGAQKLCCLIAMLFMQPCIESGTLSLRQRASRTVKVFS